MSARDAAIALGASLVTAVAFMWERHAPSRPPLEKEKEGVASIAERVQAAQEAIKHVQRQTAWAQETQNATGILQLVAYAMPERPRSEPWRTRTPEERCEENRRHLMCDFLDLIYDERTRC